jgi:hypothetical protein
MLWPRPTAPLLPPQAEKLTKHLEKKNASKGEPT